MSGVLLAAGETMAMVAPTTSDPLESAATFHVDAGGAESNVAAHAAALGQTARWFSRLGDDPLGHRVAGLLHARGVDVETVIFDSDHRTGLYVKDPGRGVHYYRADSAAAHLNEADADAVDLAAVEVVHVSGITAALMGTAPRFLTRLIERSRGAGVAISFDVNYRPTLWDVRDAAETLDALTRTADIVFVGRDEAETLWGSDSPDRVRHQFPDVPELVVKDSDIGATVYEGDRSHFIASERVEVVEAVGAGDAFAGGYLAARMAGAAPERRLVTGHTRAALTLQTTGDSVDPLPLERALP